MLNKKTSKNMKKQSLYCKKISIVADYNVFLEFFMFFYEC